MDQIFHFELSTHPSMSEKEFNFTKSERPQEEALSLTLRKKFENTINKTTT